MLAGTLGAPYIYPCGWIACSSCTYMLAVMPGVHMIISGPGAICGSKILSQPRLAEMLCVGICHI